MTTLAPHPRGAAKRHIPRREARAAAKSTTVSRRAERAFRGRAARAHLALGVILAVQTLTMLTLSNTAFQDEALYLHAGNDLLAQAAGGPEVTEQFASYFSGLPYLYPVLGALADATGGLWLARTLSTVFALVVTTCAFTMGRSLFNDSVGLLGSASLATAAPLLFIGRLATYDAMALALLALAGAIAVRTTRGSDGRDAASAGAVVVLAGLAVLTKYAAAAYAPAIGAALLLCSARRAVRAGRPIAQEVRRTRVVGLGATGMLVALGAWLVAAEPALLHGLAQTTTDRQVGVGAAATDLAVRVLTLSGAHAALAAGGLVLAWHDGVARRDVAVSTVLAAQLAIAPAYHLLMSEPVSLDKHLAFGMVFAAPAAGYVFARLAHVARDQMWRAIALALAVLVPLSVTGAHTARSLHHAWPESTAMVAILRMATREADSRILAEEWEVPQYYLADAVALDWTFTGLDYFEYVDAAGTTLTGLAAYESALGEQHFGVVVLRYGPSAEVATALTSILETSELYGEIATLPFTTSLGNGEYRVWRQVIPHE